MLRGIAKGQECVCYQREVFASKRMNHVNVGSEKLPGGMREIKAAPHVAKAGKRKMLLHIYK